NVIRHDPTFDPYAPLVQTCGWEPDTTDPDYQGYCEPESDPRCDGMVPDVYLCHTSSAYVPATDFRGNVTSVTRYADAANLGGAIVETRRYDETGNLITVSNSCCEQVSFSYTDS